MQIFTWIMAVKHTRRQTIAPASQ